MRKVSLLVLLCASLLACSTPQSPYVTNCNEPACNRIATTVESAYKAQDGLSVIVSPAIAFSAQSAASKIAAQGDVMLVFLESGQTVGVTTVDLVDIGVTEKGVSMDDFMDMVFLEPFSAFANKDLDRATLHALRSFKVAAFDGAQPEHSKRDGISVFYHQADDSEQYKVYVTDGANKDVATMIDLYGFTQSQAKDFISSVQQYQP